MIIFSYHTQTFCNIQWIISIVTSIYITPLCLIKFRKHNIWSTYWPLSCALAPLIFFLTQLSVPKFPQSKVSSPVCFSTAVQYVIELWLSCYVNRVLDSDTENAPGARRTSHLCLKKKQIFSTKCEWTSFIDTTEQATHASKFGAHLERGENLLTLKILWTCFCLNEVQGKLSCFKAVIDQNGSFSGHVEKKTLKVPSVRLLYCLIVEVIH